MLQHRNSHETDVRANVEHGSVRANETLENPNVVVLENSLFARRVEAQRARREIYFHTKVREGAGESRTTAIKPPLDSFTDHRRINNASACSNSPLGLRKPGSSSTSAKPLFRSRL